MNESPVTLIAPRIVATIRPLTETLGTVIEIVGEPNRFIAYENGDLVELPEWFIATATPAENESYWQAASKPNLTNPAGETIVTPYHIGGLPILDMDAFERGK